jgi:hypothetical protein
MLLKIRRIRKEAQGGNMVGTKDENRRRKETNGNRKKEQMKDRRKENRMDLRAEDIIKVSTLSLKSYIVCSLLTTLDAQ